MFANIRDLGKGPPPNIHGNNVFLVKLQLAITGDSVDRHILIYDRRRSIEVQMLPSDNGDVYAEAVKEIKTGWKGLKTYRWARRIGDYQLSVCFDKAPPEDPVW
jgi:hypothetical protein